MNKLDLFVRLSTYAFNNSTGIPHETQAKKVWGVTNRTVRNWLAEQSEIPDWAITNLQNYLKSRYKHLAPCDFSEYNEHDFKCYARLASSNTSVDRDRFIGILYHELNNIEKIIILSRTPNKDDYNEHLFGALICCENGYYLLDKTKMTASRRPREFEIQSIFNNIVANQLDSKTVLILEKIDFTNTMSVVDAVNTILSCKTSLFSERNFTKFYPLISGSSYAYNPSEYFNDFGEATLQYMLSTIDGIKVNYDENYTTAHISCSKNEGLSDKLHLILDKMQACLNESLQKNKVSLVKASYFDRIVEFSAAIEGNEIIVTRKPSKNID